MNIQAEGLHLWDFDEQGWKQWLEKQGLPAYRSRQIIEATHKHRMLDPALMTSLPKNVRALLSEHFKNHAPKVLSENKALDGTMKWLIDCGMGNAIETVFIPEKNRGTLCISSQVGCALACRFCLTGDQGFFRNLKTHEIIAQLQWAQSRLAELDSKEFITNIVFMGMGEPLMNELALYPTLNLLLSDHAYGFSKYRVTVSTSGVVPAMYRLKENSPCALAVSLHAANPTLRNSIVPINQKYSLDDLQKVCAEYFDRESKRSILFEYVMLAGINDQDEHAHQLIKWLAPMRHKKINLIPFNPYPQARYECSAPAVITRFQSLLRQAGIFVTLRKTRGDDTLAACGQLAGVVRKRPKLNETSS